MSVPVPVLNAEALEAEDAQRRRVTRRRTLLCVVTMLMASGMAAVPLPVRGEYQRLLAEITAIDSEVGDLLAQDAALDRREAALPADLDAVRRQAGLWLTGCDPLSMRNRLVAVAEACRIELFSVGVQEDLGPLGEQDGRPAAAMVLGAAAASDESIDDDLLEDGEPRPETGGVNALLSVTRYSLEGRGPLSGLLMFAGLLAELPEPLRLVRVDLTLHDDGAHFTLVADRLRCVVAESASGPEPGDA